MADGGVNNQYLLDLKERLRELGSACEEINTFFANEADRMARKADVKRLQNLTVSLRQRLEEAIWRENAARSASLKGDAVGSAGELIAEEIGSAMGEHAWVEKFEKSLTARRAARKRSFGMIMVFVGKGGLPDDVRVVSISELARAQNQPESAIILGLEERGVLLFTPDEFWQLIERLVRDIRKGKSKLPIDSRQLIVTNVPAKKAVARFRNAVVVSPVLIKPQTHRDTSKSSSTG